MTYDQLVYGVVMVVGVIVFFVVVGALLEQREDQGRWPWE